jgi:hypothetical protein
MTPTKYTLVCIQSCKAFKCKAFFLSLINIIGGGIFHQNDENVNRSIHCGILPDSSQFHSPISALNTGITKSFAKSSADFAGMVIPYFTGCGAYLQTQKQLICKSGI